MHKPEFKIMGIEKTLTRTGYDGHKFNLEIVKCAIDDHPFFFLKNLDSDHIIAVSDLQNCL